MEATNMTNTLNLEYHDDIVMTEVGKNVSEDFQVDKVQRTQEGEEVNKTLPEELVEKIFSMVPFPAVFKARVLSKSWLARLSAISSEHDEKEKNLAISFQNQVREQSTNWKTFCPVSACDPEHGLIAFDLPSQTMLKMLPFVSFLPKKLWKCDYQSRHDAPHDALNNGGILALEGALLLGTSSDDLYVANVLTRRWKKLPALPSEGSCASLCVRGTTLLSYSLETYMVIIVPYPQASNNFVQFYDSTSAAWSSMKIAPSLDFSFFDPDANQGQVAFLDGVLYFVTVDEDVEFSAVPCLKVFALNVQEGNSAEIFDIVAQVDMSGKELRVTYTFICNSNLLIIILYTYDDHQNFVVKIDLRSRQVLGLAPGPPDEEEEFEAPVSDGNYIFLRSGKDNFHHRLLAYDVHNDRWETLPCLPGPSTCNEARDEAISSPSTHVVGPWIPLCFRPGLNPFVTL